ncbi:hypothetical protein [Nesterenkonia ebinurensis]|uniref:hypothetical protein n=1 Tax=Nesterenkonia ebinurensis TaxID=2608252 RepID=UPI00123E1FC7|nr:hypothetical protein [Nesterenkonia ebinurensis]
MTTWDTHRRSLAIFSGAWLLGLLAACGSDEPQVETKHPAEVEQNMVENSVEEQSVEEDDDAPGLDAHSWAQEQTEAGESARGQDSPSGEERAVQFAEVIEEVFEQLAGAAVDDS